MPNDILQCAASSSGHVFNWTFVPGIIVAEYKSPAIIPLSYLSENQCTDSGSLVSATKCSATPECDIRPDFGKQRSAGNRWNRIRRRRWRRKRKSLTNDSETVTEPTEDENVTKEPVVTDDRLTSEADDLTSEGKMDAERKEYPSTQEVRYCQVCRATFNAPSQAKQHYAGRHHARRVRIRDSSSSSSSSSPGGCGRESNTFASASLSSPSSGFASSDSTSTDGMSRSFELQVDSNHDRSTSSVTQQRPAVTCRRSPGSGSRIGAGVYCALCSVAFSSDKQAVEHYAGKIHTKRLRAYDVICTYNRNGYAVPRGSRRSKSRQFPGSSDVNFCLPCGKQLSSRRRLQRHLRNQHRFYNHFPLCFSSIY